MKETATTITTAATSITAAATATSMTTATATGAAFLAFRLVALLSRYRTPPERTTGGSSLFPVILGVP